MTRSGSDNTTSLPLTPVSGTDSGNQLSYSISNEGTDPSGFLNTMDLTGGGLPNDHAFSSWSLDGSETWNARPKEHSPSMTYESSSSNTTPPTNSPVLQYPALAPKNPPPRASPPAKDGASEKEKRRQRNSIAARKYRQKRIDRIEELEKMLAKMEDERNGLKVEVEKWKTKATVLGDLVSKKT